MTITIHDILAQFRQYATDERGKGDSFERLMAAYLRLDPLFADRFSGVWLWKDWPQREEQGFSAKDLGIDLVAEERDGGGFCAIQCKFYAEDQYLPMADLGTFFTLSGKGGFTSRLIISTTDKWSQNAEDALQDQQIPVSRLRVQDLDDSPIDWSAFNVDRPEDLRRKTAKQIRPHQQEAHDAVLGGFQVHDRGKLIMACGTGKTYTSLAIMESMVQAGGHVLFLVPSLALLSQTLREWTAEAHTPLRCYAVCSDTKVGKDEEDIRVHDLAYPATTDTKKLTAHLKRTSDDGRITVIFSTYQSIDVVQAAQQAGCPAFDLVICDEAHRTAGVTAVGEEDSNFVRVHDDEYIRAKKRLYMTATPKIYKEDASQKAEEKGHLVYSMSNEAHYGPVFHRLSFAEAVGRDLLSDYKVLILAVDEETILKDLEDRIADSGDELKLDDAVKIVGCWNGLAKRAAAGNAVDFSGDPLPMKTAVAFAGNIKASKLIAKEFEAIVQQLQMADDGLPLLEAHHVDGTMDVLRRNHELDWLRENIGSSQNVCRILSNARCLSEGVDVPALDAVIFLNPRDSVVDVVQSVGRVMRKAPGKQYGYVILPIGIPSDKEPEKALDDNKKYRVVWQVLNALRAHDDRLDKEFATIDLNRKKDGKINVIGVGGGSLPQDDKSKKPEQIGFVLNFPELDRWKDAIFAKVVQKCGDRRYWEDWARDVAQIAERHKMRIEALLKHPTPEHQAAFDAFLNGLRENINPGISRDEAVEMLAQHVVTRPVFDALFSGYAFTSHNPVSRAMQGMLDVLEGQALEKESESLQSFYASVRDRVSGLDNPEARQKVIVELYDKFFRTAFPRMAERLGLVYTPVEIVDFIVKSADVALRQEFGVGLADEHVHILDPFTGTGTFLVRLIQNGLIPPDRLPFKYAHEMHANELVLLAYYIAAVNIEAAYHDLSGQDYTPFPGIVLTDTFLMGEQKGQAKTEMFSQENSERAERQNRADIRCILGNPPYSVGQGDANDNNQNQKYEALDASIRDTYVAHSTATLKNSLYDSYIRAFRWASNRIKDQGVICFVSNGGWIEGNTMDGFRKSLAEEFTSVYVFNLRGNFRKFDKREGGNIFGQGSGATIAISLLVKNPAKAGQCAIHYRDIGDYLSREDKLSIISEMGSVENVPWERISPNQNQDWINQRSEDFGSFMAMVDKLGEQKQTLFSIYSNGVKTNRDAWVYNLSGIKLAEHVERTLSYYNYQAKLRVDSLDDGNKISWTRQLRKQCLSGLTHSFNKLAIRISVYRPFSKQWIYFDRSLIEVVGKWELFMPTAHHQNLAISIPGPGESNPFSCLVTDCIPNLHVIHGGQCFPLYHYEKAHAPSGQNAGLFDEPADPNADADGYTRKDAITDTALTDYRAHYQDIAIGKEDIFYYVYGILHSPEYRERYANDLKKMLPRIPFAPDFWAFSKAGRELAYWHLNYESVEPYAGLEIIIKDSARNLPPYSLYRVEKMAFASLGGREKDKSTIQYNGYITIKGIPLEAYDYVVNGKPAIAWIMERYQVTTDKDSGIKNDPNDWCREHDDPAYIFNLVQRVVRVSVETQKIVERLGSIGGDE
ncbi:DEAD/DEAH box helicase [Acidithiobacillus ferrooxidans]|uniref:DEAD/DEAH box helicase n=1 Tax=Acidithiobacillus ferrooxidans TaxID=920 RepID=UPI001C066CD0|nr:type ISP restriction/modification enzyme [Acidithiobacillus ferrooxidans]MBU2772450.1 DEAD/DEAH box helicase [Acidithiobacillus ferrooxidans]